VFIGALELTSEKVTSVLIIILIFNGNYRRMPWFPLLIVYRILSCIITKTISDQHTLVFQSYIYTHTQIVSYLKPQ